MKSVLRFAYHVLRFLVLSLIQPKRIRMEMSQTDFWFAQAMRAADEAHAAKSQKELDLARQRFELCHRRYEQHHKHICP